MNPPEFNLKPSEPHPEWYDRDLYSTADPWPLPAAKEWTPIAKPTLRQRFAAWLDRMFLGGL